MSQHLGSKSKQLVEKHYTGSKKQFAEESGIGNATYLSRLFNSDTISMKILDKASTFLNIPITEFLEDKNIESNIVEEPREVYGNNQAELIKTLKNTIKAHEMTIRAMEVTIALLQKESNPKMSYTKKA